MNPLGNTGYIGDTNKDVVMEENEGVKAFDIIIQSINNKSIHAVKVEKVKVITKIKTCNVTVRIKQNALSIWWIKIVCF